MFLDGFLLRPKHEVSGKSAQWEPRGRTDGRTDRKTETDGRTDMRRIIGAFCGYAKGPKMKGIEFM